MPPKMPPKRSPPEEKTCEVSGCSQPALRAVNAKKASGAGLDVKVERGNVHLCKDHYRQFKKGTKEDRKLERLGW
jgi:hypothetical protein